MTGYDKIIERLEGELKNASDEDVYSEIEHELFLAQKGRDIQRKALAAEILLDEAINAPHSVDKLNAVKKALRDIAESV